MGETALLAGIWASDLFAVSYLKHLPPDQYIRLRYKDLVADPKGTVEKIYQRFGFEMSDEYEKILQMEASKAKSFRSRHRYSLKKVGLSKRRIIREFSSINKQLHFNMVK